LVDLYKHSMTFDDPVNRSPVAWEIVLILDSSGSHDGFVLEAYNLSSTVFEWSSPAFRTGFFNAALCPPALYALIHLQNVLTDMSSTLEISLVSFTPSM